MHCLIIALITISVLYALYAIALTLKEAILFPSRPHRKRQILGNRLL